MLKIDKINLKNIGSMLLIYPLIVVSFKLFIIPLEIRMTILIMLLVMVCFKLSSGNKYVAIVLSLSIYIYIRVLFLIKVLTVNIYLDGYGYFIKELIPTVDIIADIGKLELVEAVIQKTLLYILSIVIVSTLYIIINSELISKYFNAFNLIGMMYFVYAWFSYIDVEMSILLYLVGVMIFNAKYQKLGHVISLLIIMIFLLNTVSSIIPYKYINEHIGKLAPEVLILRSDYDDRESFFNFESSMYYPEDSKLGGSVVIDSNRIIMNVITAQDVVYLRGRVKDTYTGVSWENSDSNYERFESSRRYGEKKSMSDNLKSAFITYEGIRSLSIFSPIGSLEYSLDESKLMVDRDSSVYYKSGLFEESIEEYKVVFTGKDTFIEDKKQYLILPESITDRTIELALDITKDARSDREKVLIIKDFLVSNYPYSLEVNGDGNYTDFVDDFLFEEKKGYCTYYSSSLAVLSRINGIPSRYVEGYIVSPDSYDGGKYVIREDKAHAWAEIYIDGTGWSVVDSTPIYDFDADEITAIKIEKQTLLESEAKALAEDEHNRAEEKSEIKIKSYNTSQIYILILIVIVLAITIKWRYKYKNLKLSSREKALKYIYNIDDKLSKVFDFKNNNTHTVYYKMKLYDEKNIEFFSSDEQFQDQNNAIIKDVIEILYNNKNVSDYDLINLEKYIRYIKKGLL